MAVLEKMRKRMGVFISIVIALALLAFIVNPEDLQRVASMFSSKYDVGKIAGKSISHSEFSKRHDKYNRILGLTNQDLNKEEGSEMVNNVTWQSFIADEVLIPACEKAGVKVGSKEMVEMAKAGADLSPVLMNEIFFMDENGMFSQDRLQQFVQNIPYDQTGQYAEYWDNLQNNMLQDRMFTKYSVMLAKSAVSNNLQVRREIADNNNSYDVDFILQPASFEKDTAITVTNEEIKKYYEKIKPSLKKVETRDAKMVVFEILPSEKDVRNAKEDIEKLYKEFQGLSDSEVKSFIERYSDTPFNDFYVKKGDLKDWSSILDEFASSASAGTFMEPQPYDNVFVAAKVLDIASRPDSVYLKYMPVPDEKTADSLMATIKSSEQFTAEAAKYLAGQRGAEPGTIGWVTEAVAYSQLPPEFMKAFTSKKGDMFKLENNGFFVIARVDNLTNPVKKSKIAVLSRQANASQETFSNVYAEAGKLKEAGTNLEKFEKYALDNNLELYPVENLLGGAKNIGSYEKMSEVSRWIFDAKEGQVSEIFTTGDNKYYVVAALEKIHPAGYAEISEFTPQIREFLTMQKKVEKLAKELDAKVSGATTIEEASEKLVLPVSSLTGVTFSSLTGGAQNDPILIGNIAKAGADGNHSLVGPVKGSLGVAYFQIKGQNNGAFYTESDAQRKNDHNIYSILNVLPQVMCDDAKVEDLRYKFY